MCIRAIHRVRNNVSSPRIRKMAKGKRFFDVTAGVLEGSKCFSTSSQRALVARDTTLSLSFSLSHSRMVIVQSATIKKMYESMITRGIMRTGVWKVSKCISAEPNGANIFRNVHVRWVNARAGSTRTFAIRCVCALRTGCRLCSFGILSWIFFLLPRQTEIYGSDDATCMLHATVFATAFPPVCTVVKKQSFRAPLKSLRFKARRADFRFFYVAFGEKHIIITNAVCVCVCALHAYVCVRVWVTSISWAF